MPQSLDSVCSVIVIFLLLGDTAATIIPLLPCGLTRTLNSSAEINSHESKAGLIDDNNSSSTTGSNCME